MRTVLIAAVVLAAGLLAYSYLSVKQPPGNGQRQAANGQTAPGGQQPAWRADPSAPGSPPAPAAGQATTTQSGARNGTGAAEVQTGPGQAWASPTQATELSPPPAATGAERPLLRVQLRPKLITVLSSQMSGRLREVLVEDGQAVKAGQPLFSLDCGLPEAQLERAKAVKYRRDKVAAVTSQLVELKSRSSLEADVARAEAAEAAAEVRLAEVLTGRCKVAAPFDGRAGEVLARPGQHVAEGQPVMEVLSDSELEVEFVAPSRLIEVLKPGLEFGLSVDETGQKLTARLERLGGKVDPVSQSVRVYARLLSQPPGLMAGMSGVARLESAK